LHINRDTFAKIWPEVVNGAGGFWGREERSGPLRLRSVQAYDSLRCASVALVEQSWLKFDVSHPFARKKAKGWGTELFDLFISGRNATRRAGLLRMNKSA
jgi:hypothetical protein